MSISLGTYPFTYILPIMSLSIIVYVGVKNLESKGRGAGNTVGCRRPIGTGPGFCNAESQARGCFKPHNCVCAESELLRYRQMCTCTIEHFTSGVLESRRAYNAEVARLADSKKKIEDKSAAAAPKPSSVPAAPETPSAPMDALLNT